MARAVGVSPDSPYFGCHTYEKHGACVCSTGYPASCTARGEAAPRAGDDVTTDLHIEDGRCRRCDKETDVNADALCFDCFIDLDDRGA